MAKFNIVRAILEEQYDPDQFTIHEPIDDPLRWIRQVHDRTYVKNFREGALSEEHVRKIGLPWSESLVERTITAVGGTLRTVDLALETGRACNTAGGTHHAFPDRGGGFCIFNDLAVAAQRALDLYDLSSVLILDLDVHQGNGTAAFFREDPRVFTVSVHCETNYPFNRTEGDRDINVPPSTDDQGYNTILSSTLPDILDEVQPDLLLYDAGVDVHEEDRLGNLNLSNKGIARRDRFVFDLAERWDIPTAAVIGGGYDENLRTLAERHAILHQTARSEARA